MLCAYTGTDARLYPDYADARTGLPLAPVPGGGPYDAQAASGSRPGLPVPPADGRWQRPAARARKTAPPASSAPPQPAAGTAPAPTEEQQP
jgi:hypothetical protein